MTENCDRCHKPIMTAKVIAQKSHQWVCVVCAYYEEVGKPEPKGVS